LVIAVGPLPYPKIALAEGGGAVIANPPLKFTPEKIMSAIIYYPLIYLLKKQKRLKESN
jgi:hypothetical protein